MLEAKGALFTTTSDSEVIVHLIARSQAPTLAGAIAEALLEVRGAFSLVILSREGIFAARDRQRHPPALARHPRGLARRRLRDLRLRPDRRALRARRRARRDRAPDARRLRLAPLRLPGLDPLRLRARLLRAARLDGLRPQRGRRRAQGFGAQARARASGRGRRRRAGARLRDVRGPRLRRGVAHSVRARPRPQPLRRPDLHRAQAGDPPLRRQGEVEPGPRGRRGQARRARGRLDRPRHHLAQDRQDDPRGRRARSPRARSPRRRR